MIRLHTKRFWCLVFINCLVICGTLVWLWHPAAWKRRTSAVGRSDVIMHNDLQFGITVNRTASPTPDHLPCNAECTKFRGAFTANTDDKPKAAIYYLTASTRTDHLTASLTSLYNNFVHRFNYPIIIFHEKDFDDAVKHRLRSLVNIELFFQEVEFQFPPFINQSTVVFEIPCLSAISYRHMCRFHAKEVYEQPIFAGLEYVWRLDDDSLLQGPITFDVFAFMHQRGLRYGYIKIHVDSLDCTAGLWTATRNYVKLQKITPNFFNEWTDPMIYYNNFEISAMSVWKSAEYRDFIDYLDHQGGIFYHRWGDAPIKSIAISLFVRRDETFKFSDIAYRHGNFFTNSSYSSF